MHMLGFPTDFFSGWWLFGGFWMLIFWGGLIALIVWVIVRLTGANNKSKGSSPLDMAKERYARGELTRDDYQKIKQDLT